MSTLQFGRYHSLILYLPTRTPSWAVHLFGASSLDFNSNLANHLQLLPICQICSIYFCKAFESFEAQKLKSSKFFQNSNYFLNSEHSNVRGVPNGPQRRFCEPGFREHFNQLRSLSTWSLSTSAEWSSEYDETCYAKDVFLVVQEAKTRGGPCNLLKLSSGSK